MILYVFMGLQVGIVIGGAMFDMFVSRPTLRILNEEIKLREKNYQNLLNKYHRAVAKAQE